MKRLRMITALLCFALAMTAMSAQKTTAKPAMNAPAAQTAATAKPASQAGAQSTDKEAPGGGAGKVWVNTDSNVYHCPGTRYYGKTKAGKYMTEAQAKAAGAKIAKGQNCSK